MPEGARAERVGGVLLVLELATHERVSAHVRGLDFRARDYAYAEIVTRGRPPGTRLDLLASGAASDHIVGLPAPATLDGRSFVRLAKLPSWDRLDVFGVGVSGPSRAPFAVERVVLLPESPAAALRALWREWTSFEGLDGHSTNFVIGGSSDVRPPVRLVPAVAAWAALALALYALVALVRQARFDARVAAVVVGSAWLVLDLRWQADLFRQHALTRERYAGRSWTEKRLAAEDGALFAAALEIKRQLPPDPQVIYLLTGDPEGADRYTQMRARYHLLPHNVSTYDRYPPWPRRHPGSYYLVVTPREDIVFEPASGTLRWDSRGRPPGPDAAVMRVVPVVSTRLGDLYRER